MSPQQTGKHTLYAAVASRGLSLHVVQDDAAAPFVRLIALLVRQEGAQVAEYLNDFKVCAHSR